MLAGVVVSDTDVCAAVRADANNSGGDMEGLAFRMIKLMDVSGLLDLIRPEDWQEITARQEVEGTAHSDTETIYLRWCKGRDIHSVFNDLDAVDYPALDRMPVFRVLLDEIIDAVGGTLGRAMIVKLKSGGHIDKHVDEGYYADNHTRYHLVLEAEDNVFFMVDQSSEHHYETVCMRPGELWWFNHKRKHCVDNCSDWDRIHLIVDVRHH